MDYLQEENAELRQKLRFNQEVCTAFRHRVASLAKQLEGRESSVALTNLLDEIGGDSPKHVDQTVTSLWRERYIDSVAARSPDALKEAQALAVLLKERADSQRKAEIAEQEVESLRGELRRSREAMNRALTDRAMSADDASVKLQSSRLASLTEASPISRDAMETLTADNETLRGELTRLEGLNRVLRKQASDAKKRADAAELAKSEIGVSDSSQLLCATRAIGQVRSTLSEKDAELRRANENLRVARDDIAVREHTAQLLRDKIAALERTTQSALDEAKRAVSTPCEVQSLRLHIVTLETEVLRLEQELGVANREAAEQRRLTSEALVTADARSSEIVLLRQSRDDAVAALEAALVTQTTASAELSLTTETAEAAARVYQGASTEALAFAKEQVQELVGKLDVLRDVHDTVTKEHRRAEYLNTLKNALLAELSRCAAAHVPPLLSRVEELSAGDSSEVQAPKPEVVAEMGDWTRVRDATGGVYYVTRNTAITPFGGQVDPRESSTPPKAEADEPDYPLVRSNTNPPGVGFAAGETVSASADRESAAEAAATATPVVEADDL